MSQTALVVGGTGPTGQFIVNGLRARGYTVAILHRGNHEIPEIPEDVEHIHTDPHFRETLAPALEGRTFDLCIASYGRTRYVAEIMAGKCGQFLSAGGMAYRVMADPALEFPRGGAVPFPEDSPQPTEEEHRFIHLIGHTERVIRDFHPDAAVFRYPYVYGPYQLMPREWSIIRRLRDGRPFIILPDGGANLTMHGYAENIATAVLAGVDQPEKAAGQTYNCGDSRQYSLRQIVEIIARKMGREVEILPVPYEVAGVARTLLTHRRREHTMTDLAKLRSELGYRDAVPPLEAIERTVDWYLAHPPAPGGMEERNIADPFDYPLEDRMSALIRTSLAQLAELDPGMIQRQHAYAHPKKAGEPDHRGR